jgi:integrase/recombinase XerD
MIRDRGERLGIKLHPHAFRHRYADRMLSQGMHEGTVMQLGGWRTREMLDRYGAARKADRALEEASRIASENGR